jgi:hypothetical protein
MEDAMNPSAPTQLVFIISIIIALIGVLAALNVVTFIPVASVWIVTVAFVLLAAACLIRGL